MEEEERREKEEEQRKKRDMEEEREKMRKEKEEDWKRRRKRKKERRKKRKEEEEKMEREEEDDNLNGGSDKEDAVPGDSGAKGNFPGEYATNKPNRGIAIIINNTTFKDGEREGSDQYKDSLKQRFNELGFDVKVYINLTLVGMKNVMKNVAKEDHEDNDCFICAILSHGKSDEICDIDGEAIKIETLLEPFKGDNCPSLVGKPKIFFIQAYCGKETDTGVTEGRECATEVQDEEEIRIPIAADFLLVYSVEPDHVSTGNTVRDSWFVQAISEVFRNHAQEYDLLKLMNKVKNRVVSNFKSTKTREKEMPCISISSMLTKAVYFRSKN